MATENDPAHVIVESLMGAFKKYPRKGDGTSWDDQTISRETSMHLAGSLLADLEIAGFEIVKRRNSHSES